ncbi:hypothetical protein THAOC_09673 [Thalassiosira oceanica]|uniref:Uncharacterized protein n=1 Tax=Thalassiosira oceanica TaxID=159749 RepID=K0SVY6_THAOC|nr:hypothetical protein THAOC_09673 [Thalassiosira oceanica]|eukprot:EJK69104.1 hypothetical protein THAOC_09673 [Thalassiosira oceanica]
MGSNLVAVRTAVGPQLDRNRTARLAVRTADLRDSKPSSFFLVCVCVAVGIGCLSFARSGGGARLARGVGAGGRCGARRENRFAYAWVDMSLDQMPVFDHFDGLSVSRRIVVKHWNGLLYDSVVGICFSNIISSGFGAIVAKVVIRLMHDAMDRRSVFDRFDSLAVLLCNIGTGLSDYLKSADVQPTST